MHTGSGSDPALGQCSRNAVIPVESSSNPAGMQLFQWNLAIPAGM